MQGSTVPGKQRKLSHCTRGKRATIKFMSSTETRFVAQIGPQLPPGQPAQTGSSFVLGDAYLLDAASGTTVADTFGTPASLINVILPNIFVFAGILLFIFVVVAGMRMVLSPDDKKNAEEGKKAITFAVTGFAVILGAYWIVQIIEILTGVDILL